MHSAQDTTTPGSLDETSLRYAGWRVVLACFLMALFLFGFGLYGHGVYLAELQRLHGWPAASIAGGSTLSLLVSNILAMFTPELMARLGPKRLALFGLAGFASSMVLLAGVTELWQLYAAFTLMSLGWIGMGTVVIATVVSGWFEQRRGLAISLAFNGASFGGVVVTPLLVMLVEKVGFSAAMLISTAIMLMILLPVIGIWITPRQQGATPAAHPAPSQNAVAGESSRLAIMRQLAFWTVTAAFALALTAQVGVIVHLIALLEPKLGRAGAGFAVSLMTVMAVTGRFSIGLVIDRLDPRWVTAVSVAGQAAALVAILHADSTPMLLAACAVFGYSVGNLITLPPLIIHREFNAASFTAVLGLATAISGTACALGPVLVGIVRGWSGDYRMALMLCIALQLSAIVVVLQPRLSRSRPAVEGRG